VNRKLIGAVAALLALPAIAWAHPHVMVDVTAVVMFDKGLIHSVALAWKFDPVFSATLVQDFDKNKNGQIDGDELKDLERDAFQNTREQDYFTYLKLAGQKIKAPKAVDFKLNRLKDSLVYTFRIPLPRPVDPRKESFSFSTYEETYYIDIGFPTDKSVIVHGDGSDGCRAVMSDDRENAIFGGVVVPKKVEVKCE
jgi:tRNA threonylcarbamoyladenosine biosynthesis protein TsaE